MKAVKLLALDTSTEACSAAAWVDDEIIERYELAPRSHAQLILSMIEAVLAETGIAPAELDAVAFGRGPGAFTGIRIATAVAQGIAFAADLPLIPISTLAAIGLGAVRDYNVARVAVAVDARMGEVYWGAYEADTEGGVVLRGEEQVCPPGAVPVPMGEGWFGAGSGWAAYAEILGRHLGVTRWQDDCYPRAGDIAVLGALAWKRGEAVAPEQALPVYLRDNIATKNTVPP